MRTIQWRPKHRSPDGKNDHKSTYGGMQDAHTCQTEPVAPEENPQADPDGSHNDVVEDDILGQSNPCGEVNKEDRSDAQYTRFTDEGQPEIRFFLPVEPEECQGHQQCHDKDQQFQETAANVVSDVIPIQADLVRDCGGIA